MPDIPTIRATIKKRVPELVVDPVVTDFIDGVGIAVCVEVRGRAYPMIFRLRRGPSRGEILNVVDGIHDTMKRIARENPTVEEYMAGRRTMAVKPQLSVLQ